LVQSENLLSLPLEEVIGDRFGRYSKYIIQERALPDVRDGLKPVQRRILYAMNEDGNTFDKNFRKAARTVGTVIGNYHPHGDTSVYDAMVRLSQDWKMRHVLIEMHGNNGSIDGDPAAAMRYTETKLAKISSELLRDIEKNTVDFVPNFDDTNEEPIVFPAKFPNLLVNGSTGISAGYATDIPPHNLQEVIDAVIKKIDKPSATVAELMEIIKGPDFPTGGIVQGTDGIKKAYKTGRGRMIIRGRATIEKMRGNREKIVIDEIPYDINKANLVRKIDELAFDRKVEGIAEVRDETDRTGLRIVIELRKDAHSEGVLNYLYKHTDLQVSYNFNMVAIQDKTPKLLSLPEMLDAYIDHQKEVVTRQTTYDLTKAKERAHIVEGLIKAISILDELIQTIRASKNKQDAKQQIMKQFQFTEQQAEAIVTLQLYRLTNTDVTALEKEATELNQTIKKLEAVLASEKKLLQTIKQDLRRVKKTYHSKRLTSIEEEIETIEVDIEAMVASENVLVSVTKDGYIKRTSLRSYTASNGEDFPIKDDDYIVRLLEINTTDNILLFTNKGRYVSIPVHELPDIRWKDVGQHLSHLTAVKNDELIIACIPIQQLLPNHYLVFFTKNGIVKRSELSLYNAKRFSRPLIALNLREDDELLNVELTTGEEHIFVVTNTGYGLLYEENDVNPVGQRATGVISIQLKEDEHVVNGFTVLPDHNESLVFITQRGACKRMSLTSVELSKRAYRGQLMLRELKGKPHRIVGSYVTDEDDTLVLRTTKDYVEKISPFNLPISDRLSNGSFIIDEDEHGNVQTTWRLVPYERPFAEDD